MFNIKKFQSCTFEKKTCIFFVYFWFFEFCQCAEWGTRTWRWHRTHVISLSF